MTTYNELYRIGQKVDVLQQLNYQGAEFPVILNKIVELEKSFEGCKNFASDDDKIIYNYTKANYGAVLIEIAEYHGNDIHNVLPYSNYKTHDEFLYDYEMLRLNLYREALILYDNQKKSKISNTWMNQVRVNLANVYGETGRIIEALEILESCKDDFGMARINYAAKLYQLSQYTLEKEMQKELLLDALFYYETTIKNYPEKQKYDSIPDDIYKSICSTRKVIVDKLDSEYKEIPIICDLPEDFDDCFGIEINKYKHWCRDERLILSVRNIHKNVSIIDDIHLPNMGIGYFAQNNSLSYYSWYNILKQEYNQARYYLYLADNLIYKNDVHESQEDILLINTLDYPAMGYRTELLKSALKTAYGVLDKIGLLNNDFVCGKDMPAGKISFKNWFQGVESKIKLNDKFTPFYWVEKDLSKNGYFSIFRMLRHVIEHRYLRVVGNSTIPLEKELFNQDKMEYIVSFSELKEQVFAVLRLIRSLMFYVVFAYNECYLETIKMCEKSNQFFMPLSISYYDDDWKN